MNVRIGTSIFIHLVADNFDLEKYLTTCGAHQISFIFTTLIFFQKNNQKLLTKMEYFTKKARELNIAVYGNLDQHLFDEFNIDKNKRDEMMAFFVQELGLSGVRFDDGVTGPGIAKVSNNNQNIKVILNGTDPSRELEYIISANANKENLISCWNFYPQRYTASSIAFFAEPLAYVHQCGIKMQAFVALQQTDTVGPWDYNDKLPSLEFHRDLPLDFQIRHLMAMGVEDIAISTQFINEAEFAIIKDINLNKISLAIAVEPELSPVEQAILFDQEVHFVRQDLAEYIVRSTWSRIKYHEQDIPARGTVKEFQPGDVVILNNKAKNYAGELHIILKPMPNDGIRNLVNHLDENEQEIVKYLQPNTEFVFNQKR